MSWRHHEGQVPRGLPQPPPQLVFAPLRLTGFGEAPKGLLLSVRTAFLGLGHPTNLCTGEVQQAGGDVNAHDLGDPHDGRSHFGVRGGDQGVLASKHLGSTPDRRIEPGHRNAVGTDRLGCRGLVIAQPSRAPNDTGAFDGIAHSSSSVHSGPSVPRSTASHHRPSRGGGGPHPCDHLTCCRGGPSRPRESPPEWPSKKTPSAAKASMKAAD